MEARDQVWGIICVWIFKNNNNCQSLPCTFTVYELTAILSSKCMINSLTYEETEEKIYMPKTVV